MSSPHDLKVIRKRPEVKSSHGEQDLEKNREEGRLLLERLIRGMVDYPDTVMVSFEVGDKTTVFKIECDQKCLGQLIGVKGKNITGVRAVMAATMARKGIRAIVEIPYHCIDV